MLGWYNAAIDTGHAIGALAATIPSGLVLAFGLSTQRAHAVVFAACGALVMAGAVPYAGLGSGVEVDPLTASDPWRSIPAETRSRVRRIAGLFAVDSIGG